MSIGRFFKNPDKIFGFFTSTAGIAALTAFNAHTANKKPAQPRGAAEETKTKELEERLYGPKRFEP